MVDKNEVEKFLADFKIKMKFFGVVFRDDRNKNMDTTTALELNVMSKIKILEDLLVEDYSEGPLKDTLNNIANMWVFGKIVKKKEIYIKISMGFPNNPTICISFHFSEHPINYKFKKQ